MGVEKCFVRKMEICLEIISEILIIDLLYMYKKNLDVSVKRIKIVESLLV